MILHFDNNRLNFLYNNNNNILSIDNNCLQLNEKPIKFGNEFIQNNNDSFIIRYKNNFTLMDESGNLNLEVLDNVIDIKNKTIDNVKDPVSDLQVANKKYVDNNKQKRFVYNQKIFW